jgi:soluble lytic murein transglycosylase-like protein
MSTPETPATPSIEIPYAISRWQSLAEKYAITPLTYQEILAEIWSESSGDDNAVNPGDPSYGLMGVELPIGKKYGDFETAAELMIPDNNVKAGAGFLRDLKMKYAGTYPIFSFGQVSPIGWIAAYNEGEPNLWKKRPDLGYVQKFVRYMTMLGGQL